MFKCLREISSQGMGAVGERLVEEVLKCAVSTVTGAARAHDSGTVICYQSHKIQIKHTALKQGLQMWVCFSLHVQSSSRCLEQSKAAFHSRYLCYSFHWPNYTFKREPGKVKEKRRKNDAFCQSNNAVRKYRWIPQHVFAMIPKKEPWSYRVLCPQSHLLWTIFLVLLHKTPAPSSVQPQSSCPL